MNQRFNIIRKLKYSKATITFIVIGIALITFSLPIILLILFPSDTTAKISIVIFVTMIILIYPLENNWLHKTKVTGQAYITDDYIEWNNERVYWKELSNITVKKYINIGFQVLYQAGKVAIILNFTLKAAKILRVFTFPKKH